MIINWDESGSSVSVGIVCSMGISGSAQDRRARLVAAATLTGRLDNMLLPPCARITPAGLEIRLKVIPGAKRAQIVGLHGDRLKLRVSAPPEDGKANRAVLELLADAFGTNHVQLTAGHTSPEKTVLVQGLSDSAGRQLLAHYMTQ